MNFFQRRRSSRSIEARAHEPSDTASEGPEERARRRYEGAVRSTAAVSSALEHCLGVMRRLVDPDVAELIVELQRDLGRAMVPEDFSNVAAGVAELPVRAAMVSSENGRFATEVFHHAVFGARPIAEALGLRGVTGDLAELLELSRLSPDDERSLRRLLRSFESLVTGVSRLRESTGVVKSCVAELIDLLVRFAEGERGGLHRLEEIRARLVDAEDVDDLERLRELLLRQASALVDMANWQRAALHDAVTSARASQARAAAMEASMMDLEEQSRRDPLTGLGNRRALEGARLRLEATGEPVGVLAVDLDRFKSINDTYGHAAGDRVLCHLADLFRGELRGDDEAFRVGGEEVVVLLPKADWQGTRTTAERLRRRLERSSVPVGGERAVQVTASIGVALWTPAVPFERAMEEADDALYRAKEGGRNRVVG